MTPQDFLSKEQVSGPALKSVSLPDLSGVIPPAHCWYALKARRFFRRRLCPAPPVAPKRAVTALPRSSLSVNPSSLAPSALKLPGSLVVVAHSLSGCGLLFYVYKVVALSLLGDARSNALTSTQSTLPHYSFLTT